MVTYWERNGEQTLEKESKGSWDAWQSVSGCGEWEVGSGATAGRQPSGGDPGAEVRRAALSYGSWGTRMVFPQLLIKENHQQAQKQKEKNGPPCALH